MEKEKREITGDGLELMKETSNGNTCDRNSGDFNSGHWNSGDFNSGYCNSGDCNSGHWNSGDLNSGYCNSGDCNSGNRNSGIANSCNYSSGIFCNEDDNDIRIFNKPSGMSLRDFYNSRYWEAMKEAPFYLTEWVMYSEEERKEYSKKDMIGGYLKTYTMKEAWAAWWSKLSKNAKKTIQEIPNFDAKIFKDITGIEV